MRPFDESLVQIVRYEWNVLNPRFGMPVMYRVTLNDPREQHSGVGLPMSTVFVHWSRVIHLADNRGSSEVFGVPRQRPVLNNLLSVQKVAPGDAEAFWKNCFTGDTKFFDGHILRELKDCVGEEVGVTCADGKQRSATVRAFGKRKVVDVVLKPKDGRGTNFRRVFRATLNHRWVLEGGGVTESLKPGDVLAANRCGEQEFDRSPAGFAHGFVFGDGCMKTGRSHYFELRLCGDKKRWFSELKKAAHIAHESMASKDGDPHLIFVNHDTNLKRVPDTERHSANYVRSFIEGWLAADSHDQNGICRTLSCSNSEAVDWFVENAPYYGYEVTGHTVDDKPTNYGERSAPLHSVRYRQEPQGYRVVAIVDRGEEEEAYCVVEPQTGTFTLAGGVVTGNCVMKLILETHPSLGGDVEIDAEGLKGMMEDFGNSLQPYLALMGMTGKPVAPAVVDPTPHLDVQIKLICLQLSCPVPVFQGYEIGEQASENNDSNWKARLQHRRQNYLTPFVIVPLVDRLIQVGVLPEPEGYSVKWPDLDSLTKKDQAGVALQRTQALSAYVSGGVESLMQPQDYLTRELDYSEEEAQEIIDATQSAHEKEETMTMPPQVAGRPLAAPPGTQDHADAQQAAKQAASALKVKAAQGPPKVGSPKPPTATPPKVGG
jgi:hypothetical protein